MNNSNLGRIKTLKILKEEDCYIKIILKFILL